MTDWATRTSTAEHPLKEMESAAPPVDDDATIAAIRRILAEQAHLLPADVTESVAARQASVAAPAAAVRAKSGVLSALRALRR